MSASKSLVQSSVTKVFAASLVGYMSGEVAGRDVDHDNDDDDDDEKGQWNRSIASLRSELSCRPTLRVWNYPTMAHVWSALAGIPASLHGLGAQQLLQGLCHAHRYPPPTMSSRTGSPSSGGPLHAIASEPHLWQTRTCPLHARILTKQPTICKKSVPL